MLGLVICYSSSITALPLQAFTKYFVLHYWRIKLAVRFFGVFFPIKHMHHFHTCKKL